MVWKRVTFGGLIVVCLITYVRCAINYIVGAGIADITGPAAEVDMMGYANPGQTARGIHFRQYSRAFIIGDSDNKTRVVFISVDTGMVSQLIKLEVISRLKAVYGDLYTERNVVISGIHTHSGPGGFHQYLLFDITSLGFVKESYSTFVAGVVQSVKNAHESVQPGNIYMNEGELLDSNINRSPTAYANNPGEERAKYVHNVDKNMTVLKFVDRNGNGIGMISWFAVHCTSMNNTNRLISGDNKGYASQLFEREMNKGTLPGQGKFVAAFAQSNEGDVSPNTKGPHCLDTGLPCDNPTSTCNGKNEMCVAFGPGKDMTDSTRIIGLNQYNKAMELYKSASKLITGPVDFKHTYVDMTNVEIQLNSTTKVKTCKPAMGYSFAAGTTDGPGMFNFVQGSKSENLFWDLVRDFLATPTDAQRSCHAPKPILLDTGEIKNPYQWQPYIVDVQLLRVGSMFLVAVPGEFSTMSGRRLRNAVSKVLTSGGVSSTPVIAGLSNDYADYITTFEEYQIQRYEGASTIYGPHTLRAYIQNFELLAEAMIKGTKVAPGPNPPNLLNKQLSFLPPVIFDLPPAGKQFGSVVQAPDSSYNVGDIVTVKFVSGNPRNSVEQANFTSFLTVEKQTPSSWEVMLTDADWDTLFEWHHTSFILGESEVTITWNITATVTSGNYRITHHGHHKSIGGTITPYKGTTTTFKVGPAIDVNTELKKLLANTNLIG
ncbi:uncharacterized protein LOC135479730 [Liolophura sinensis]|uniref:uncharacterized protein LOC135479730 n=1 Tax=Liolophura sinensis TaxID=3198878 RepID=UPI003158EAC6